MIETQWSSEPGCLQLPDFTAKSWPKILESTMASVTKLQVDPEYFFEKNGGTERHRGD